MIYPENFEKKIGFDSIRELLSEKCISDLGRDHVQDISFSSDYIDLQRILDEVQEFRLILGSERNFPSQDYFDLRDELSRITLEGTYIEQEELFNLKTSLNTLLTFYSSSANQKMIFILD
jgi:DNA mismatch repair protein MutS2